MYLRAHKSPRRHASCNAATARSDRRGISAAKLTVLGYVVDHLTNLPAGHVPFHDLDRSRVERDAAQRLLDSSPLAAPLDSIEEFRSRLAQLAALREEKPSAYQPDVAAVANESVTTALEPLRTALAALQDANPLALEKVCEAGRRRITEIRYEDRAPQAVNGLARIRDALTIVAGPSSPVPQHKREAIQRQLLAAGHDAVRQELAGLARHAVALRFRHEMNQLADQLRERAQLSHACLEHLRAAVRLLRDRRDANTEPVTGGDTTGEIVLPGPTAEAVLNAMTHELQCSRAKMIPRLSEAYLQRIATQSRDFVEEGRGPLAALAALDPQATVSAIDDVVEPYVRQFSLYQAVKQYGPARLAEDLRAEAEPLLHLSRESSLLNVELTPVTIVDLPHAETKEDEAIRAELQTHLERHPPVNVRETPSSIEAVQIVRSLAGYSAALLADNDSLAVAYVESRRLEHHPHLFGLLADVPDGLASELLVETFRQLQPQELCHEDCHPSDNTPTNGD